MAYVMDPHKLALCVNNSAPDVAYKVLSNWHYYAANHFRFKDPVDVLHPVLMVSKTAIPDNWKQFNYAHIDTFNRFYYAKFICENAGMLLYQLDVDPLTTYIDSLIQRSYMIERSAKSVKANSLLFADSERPVQANKQVERFTDNLLLTLPETTGGGYYLTVSGGAAT